MIIVTGGAGFIGSAVVWGLNQRGESKILVVDQLDSSDKWKNLSDLSFLDYFEKDKFRELIRERKLPDSITAIIHMGACSSTTEKNASFLIDNNYEYTKELASFAIEKKIQFIYASSAATYGDGAHGYDDDHACIRNLRAMNMYGYSKQLFDLWAINRGLLTRIVGLKFSNVFGPNEYHKGDMCSVPLKAFEQIRQSGAVKLFKSYKKEYADGEQKRDFLYIKDAVAMTLFFLYNKKVKGIYNIGSGNARTWNDLAKAAFSALNLEPRIEYIDMPEPLRDRYQYFTELKMEKLRSAGYPDPVMSLEDGITDYVQRYLVDGRRLS
jgi:ADP-L-glycero-D-manno-heptose 6-epimerase